MTFVVNFGLCLVLVFFGPLRWFRLSLILVCVWCWVFVGPFACAVVSFVLKFCWSFGSCAVVSFVLNFWSAFGFGFCWSFGSVRWFRLSLILVCVWRCFSVCLLNFVCVWCWFLLVLCGGFVCLNFCVCLGLASVGPLVPVRWFRLSFILVCVWRRLFRWPFAEGRFVVNFGLCLVLVFVGSCGGDVCP